MRVDPTIWWSFKAIFFGSSCNYIFHKCCEWNVMIRLELINNIKIYFFCVWCKEDLVLVTWHKPNESKTSNCVSFCIIQHVNLPFIRVTNKWNLQQLVFRAKFIYIKHLWFLQIICVNTLQPKILVIFTWFGTSILLRNFVCTPNGVSNSFLSFGDRSERRSMFLFHVVHPTLKLMRWVELSFHLFRSIIILALLP